MDPQKTHGCASIPPEEPWMCMDVHPCCPWCFLGLNHRHVFKHQWALLAEAEERAEPLKADGGQFLLRVIQRMHLSPRYPVVIINWVQYLGPPVPFSFPDSRDLLEVLGDFLGRERAGGSLGDPPGP